ncbi:MULTISPECIES: hypothetical protein [unclassified Myroides]|uniref:hypothetical protein n=1 Tax=unclassified Myroides TaxID=2642485 RepID=UPI0015F84CB0|nr:MULTISPECIES: hypothetical protein [unclassified Myroides]MBB1149751.1 hypothetical protein [Myroides sp. NP-2]MDM1408191.1 hypothetical protein [Myroides sp. DF42-4-2]
MSHFKLNLEDIFVIDKENKKKIYDIQRCEAFILERGIAIYGHHFMMSFHQRQTFFKLIIYAIGDSVNMEKHDLDGNKGLLLMGERQSGKTAYMRLIQYFFSRRRTYDIKSSRLLAQEFSCKGYEAFTPLFAPNAKAICLDNIGTEQQAKFYGSTCDVVYNTLEHFYEQRFDLTYPRLHFTTCLSASELEKKYGTGFRQMLKEMVNVIVCEQ